MNPFLLSYIIVGIVFVYLENKLLKEELPEFEEMSGVDKVFCLSHQLIHYFRVWALWPLYVFDELLIYLYSLLEDEEE